MSIERSKTRGEKEEIRDIINLETKAWNTQDVELLLSIFHREMVWPWPANNQDHDPMDWVFVLGKFNHDRWKRFYQDFFQSHTLVHDKREIKKIELSKERDAAFAVVDIDTLWDNKSGQSNHWMGRVCKVYGNSDGIWKMTMHTGALQY